MTIDHILFTDYSNSKENIHLIMLTHVGFKKKMKSLNLLLNYLYIHVLFFFLLKEINCNICLCYAFETFPQNINMKNIEICVNFFKENKID